MEGFDLTKLTRQIKRGNFSAFNTLFNYMYDDLCLYSAKVLVDYELSRDVVQEVFIKIWTDRKNLPAFDDFKSYMYKTVRNKSFDYLKKIQQKDKYHYEVVNSCVNDYNRVNEIELKELEDLIFKTISKLPARTQEVYKYSRNKEKTYKEIAKSMDISIKTVEAHISAAIKELKHSVANYFEN
jgi:RNA polymerase sigma-70 factor (ECF subfamily)